MSAKFVPVASAIDIPEGAARAFTIGPYEVAVFHIGGEFFALENVCPHQGGPLAEGYLDGPLVTCPWHAWCFDVRSGKMTLGDYARVPRFTTKLEGTTVFVATQPDDDGR